MFHNLAVGVSAGPESQFAFEQALQLAESTSARLHLLVALEDETISDEDLFPANGVPSTASSLPPEEAMEDQYGAPLPAMVDRLRERCHERAVACTVHAHRGPAASWLPHEGQVAELLALGRTEGSHRRLGQVGRTVRALLRRPSLPLWLAQNQGTVRRSGLVLYEAGLTGNRALVLAGKMCTSQNIPLAVIAPHRGRGEADRLLKRAREVLRAFAIGSEVFGVRGSTLDALRETIQDRHPSLVVVPVPKTGWRSFYGHPLCRQVLQAPEAAAVFVP
jgi:nucleotide-binding universal stress UspA family protein